MRSRGTADWHPFSAAVGRTRQDELPDTLAPEPARRDRRSRAALRADRPHDRDRPLRDPRRRDRVRADRRRRHAPRGRRASVGRERDPRRAGPRRGAAPPLRGGRLRRDHDQHLGARDRRARRAACACATRTGRCTGWTSRGGACASRAPRPPPPGAPTRWWSPSASTATSTRPDGQETIRLLARAFEADPPDLILLETLSLVRSSTYQTVEGLLATGLPVWLSFRRCRHGVCGVYGEHWGGPEGDAFGRAARRFEELGASALLINCIPPDHATGMLSWLRDFTDLPLGVYPNLGLPLVRRLARTRPRSTTPSTRSWRWTGAEEGAQIIGGCCGVGPDHVAAARSVLAGTRAGHRRIAGSAARARTRRSRAPRRRGAGRDARGRELFPLPFPDIAVDEEVGAPEPGQPARVEAPPPRGARRRRSAASTSAAARGLHDGRARAQRRRPRPRDRHQPGRRAQHADERVPQRRRRPRAARPPSTSTRGCPPERYDLIVATPLAAAARPVRPARLAPPARLLGPQPDRPPDPAAARGAGADGGVAYVTATVDHRRAQDDRGARERGLRLPGPRLRVRRLRRAQPGAERADHTRRGALGRVPHQAGRP